MQQKPRVGLILMRTDLFGCGQADGLRTSLENDARAIAEQLGRRFDVRGPWVVDSAESLQASQHTLRDTDDLDMILLTYQTWAEDAFLVSLIQSISSCPVVVWCYLPWRRLPRPATSRDVTRGSGPVGTFGALATLKNLNIPFQMVYGAPDDPRLVSDLAIAGRAAQVRRALRGARFGLVPSPNEQIKGLYVDEFRLMTEIGPNVQHISVSELKRVVDSLSRVRVESYIDLVRRRFTIQDVSDETLAQAAKAALGLAHLAVDNRLDVLAINDGAPEIQRTFQMRPSLYPDLLEPLPVLFQPEADLGAATANFILSRLTDSPTMFLELWFWDEAKNHWLGGHNGLQNPALAEDKEVLISHDYDICRPQGSEGAQFQFMARSGRITLFQLRSTPRGWQAIAASGVCLEGQPWVEGYPHAIVRMDAPVEHFLNRVAAVGATQHWIMAYGSVLSELESLCAMMNIPLEVLAYP